MLNSTRQKPSELPNSWKLVSLESLISFAIGGDWGESEDFESPEYVAVRCIRASELRNWKNEKGKTASIRKIKKSSLDKRELLIGDILVEISGGGPEQPVGRTVLVDKSVLFNHPDMKKVCTNFFRLIRPADNIFSDYLNYFLMFFYGSGSIHKYQAGSNNLRNLKFKDYLSINVPLPQLDTQKAIVVIIEELFSELDSGVESLKTTKEQLKIYRQSLLKHAFEGKLTEQWRKDNPDKLENPEQLLARVQQEREARYQQQLEEWKQAVKNWETSGKEGKKPKTPIKPIMLNVSNAREIDLLPEVWCWMKFGDLITIASNLVSPLDYQSLPHIAPDNIERDTGKLLPYKTVEEDGVTSPKHYFYAGQIIYSKIRPNLSKLTHVGFDGLCSADMYPLQSDYYNHEFLKYLMLTKDFVTQASTAGSRSVLPKINQTELNSLLVPLCGLHEQQEVVNLLEEKLSIIEQNEKEVEAALAKAELLRQSILKKAFSGRLV